MIKQVTIGRNDGGGRYAEMIDVCEFLAKRVYGSTVNAVKQLAVGNPEYARALQEMQKMQASSQSPGKRRRPK